jgi:origin recognition complex subunit 1
MSFTPRRSTRGAVFTPSPFPSSSLAGPSTDTSTSYHWLSPATYPSGSTEPHYTSLKRVIDLTNTPGRRKGKGKAKAGDGETKFNVGDGVMVAVEGSSEGVGIITRMWEEEVQKEKDEDESDEEMPDQEEEGEKEMIKMAEIHWCFRRFELPGIMKNLTVEDVSLSRTQRIGERAHGIERSAIGCITRQTRNYPITDYPAHETCPYLLPSGL